MRKKCTQANFIELTNFYCKESFQGRRKKLFKTLKKKCAESKKNLVAFWQESIFLEANEGTISPQASVIARVIEAACNSPANAVTLAELSQVVVSVETSSNIEESQFGENVVCLGYLISLN